MRINDAYTKLNELTTGATGVKPADAKSAHRAHRAQGSGDGEKVTLSAEARAMAAKQDDGVDQAKVERLRDAIQSGNLSIDPHAIAAKLVGGQEG